MNRLFTLTALGAVVGGATLPVCGAFIPGDLVILTTPIVASPNDTRATSITINEYAYNPATGAFSSTPTAHSVTGITLPSTNDHDGILRVSTDGNYLTFGGYQAAVGTDNVVASTAPRAIGAFDSNWNLTTTPISGYTGVSLRSVSSTDGKQFWTAGNQSTSGQAGGQYYVDTRNATITQNLINSLDARANIIVPGPSGQTTGGPQLWSISSGNGPAASTVGTGLPTSTASTTFQMSGNDAKSDVVFLDLNRDGTYETAYTTDGKNIIGKWFYNGTSWSEKGSYVGTKANITNIDSLEAFQFGTSTEVLAATQTGQLFEFTDTNGSNAIGSGFGGTGTGSFGNATPSPLFTASGTEFRGMAILVPEPAALSLIALATPLLLRRRRGGQVR